MNRILHCIGDSHVSLFRGCPGVGNYYPECPDPLDSFRFIRTYHAGSYLAYNLCDINHNGRITCEEIIKKYIDKNDIVLLAFGEIDCRNHIVKQAQIKNVPIEETVIECVDRYWQFIDRVKSDYTTIVYGPVPSSNRPYYKVIESHDKIFPYCGTGRERNFATKTFNDYLKYLCELNDVGFVTLFYKMIQANGYNNRPGYYQDNVHLGQKAMLVLQKEFKKNKIAAEVSFERK